MQFFGVLGNGLALLGMHASKRLQLLSMNSNIMDDKNMRTEGFIALLTI